MVIVLRRLLGIFDFVYKGYGRINLVHDYLYVIFIFMGKVGV